MSLASLVSITARTKYKSSEELQSPASNDPQNTYFLKIMSPRTTDQTDLHHLMDIHSKTQASSSINPATD